MASAMIDFKVEKFILGSFCLNNNKLRQNSCKQESHIETHKFNKFKHIKE